jgi:hypothetical protein
LRELRRLRLLRGLRGIVLLRGIRGNISAARAASHYQRETKRSSEELVSHRGPSEQMLTVEL